ncbi:MFS transporter [Amnimonas aquatica]|uniref:MFS transporter n=2 Tax=Amnimonas aquatica TaxID=2094561 RepID=A0A2P6ASC5_9GAMM|nr:MFS transporter [Amnimonas aquatica]
MRQYQASLPFILITVFIDVLGIGLMLPVLPALVGELAGSPEQQSYWYGALLVTFGLAQFLAMPWLGALSDRYGRRPVLLLSIFGLGAAYLITATTDSLLILVLSRLLSGATSASFTVANAYVADITTPAERSKGFGAIGAAFGLGFIAGPMLGGLLAESSLRLPFWVAAGMALLNWLYGWFVLPESLPPERRVPIRLASSANPFAAMKHLSRLEGAAGLVVVYALVLLAQWLMHSTWVLYTSFRFDWTPRDNGIALCLFGLTSALAQGLLLGRLLPKLGENRLLALGLGSSIVASAGYGMAGQPWMLYVLILCNLLAFMVAPLLQGRISRAAPESLQGLTQGALNAIASLSTVIAPLIGTTVLAWVAHLPADDWRLGSTFFISGLLQLAALALVWHCLRAPAVPPAATGAASSGRTHPD